VVADINQLGGNVTGNRLAFQIKEIVLPDPITADILKVATLPPQLRAWKVDGIMDGFPKAPITELVKGIGSRT
jgi:hypothetical protein